MYVCMYVSMHILYYAIVHVICLYLKVQYSLLDRRPLQYGLVSLCKERNIKILAYGVLAGGFLTDAWLGVKAPTLEVYSVLSHQMEL